MPKKKLVIPNSDLPTGLSQPSLRAFSAAGLTRVDHFTKVSEADVLKLHGVGPKAIVAIRKALAERGKSFG
jgi:hypothetical protein